MFKTDVGRRRAFIINFTYLLIFAAIVYVIAKYLVPLLAPFVLAFVIAALLQKPIRFVYRKTHINKRLCGLAVAILFFVVLFGLIYLGGGGVLGAVQRMLINLPAFYDNTIEPLVMDVFGKLETIKLGNNLHLVDLLNDLETQLMDALAGMATSISAGAVSFVSGFAASLPGLFIKLVLFVIATVFISMDYDVLMGWTINHMSEKARNLFFDVKEYIVGTLFVVIRSYLIIMSITFVELSIGFSIIGIDNAILIALCIAIFDILPVLGTGGVVIPWIVVNLVLGNFGMAASLALLYVIVTVVRNIIEPKIVGSQLGLHPIVTLSSMFAGVQLLGGIGLFGFPIGLSLMMHLNKKGTINIFKNETDGTEKDETASEDKDIAETNKDKND